MIVPCAGGGCADATTFRGVTIAQNTAPVGSGILFRGSRSIYAAAKGTILANNPASQNCANDGPPSSPWRLTDAGTNIETGRACGLVGSDRSNIDPRLGPLASNGGPTDTHALLDGSPAIDTHTAGDCPPHDQRGYARPAGAACDVGAFERGGRPPLGFVPIRPLSDVLRGVLTLIPTGDAHTTSLRGGDFRPCTSGKSVRLAGAHGFFEPRDAQVALRGDVVFRFSAQKLVRLGNLLLLLDGTSGRILALLAPMQGPLPLFTLEGLRYGQGSVHARVLLAPAAARLLNRLLALQGFRAGMQCGQLDLRVAIGRDPGPPPPVNVSPPPPPPSPAPPPPPPPPPQQQTFTLTVSVDPGSAGHVTGMGIDCPSDCTETYTAGTSVTLNANPESGYEFDDWDGACSGSGDTCTLTMDSDKSATANFDRANPACDDGKDNDGDGAVDYPADKGCSSKDGDSEK